MIFGVGVDVVDVERFERQLERAPRLRERLFTERERELSPRSLAARFAVKEAFFKAMGGTVPLVWSDIEVSSDSLGKPGLVLGGEVRARASACGVSRYHVSLSHDGGVACAFVVAERDEVSAP